MNGQWYDTSVPDYRRSRVPGGTYSFTTNAFKRRTVLLLVRHIEALREAMQRT